jgi:hypothetical protein
MLRKLTRTGMAMVLAGAAVASTGLPAQAQMKPRVGQGEEVVILYYSNAQHTTLVGEHEFGCVYYTWGTESSYTSGNEYLCN